MVIFQDVMGITSPVSAYFDKDLRKIYKYLQIYVKTQYLGLNSWWV